MKKVVFYSMMMYCLLTAGKAGAAGSVYLPATVVRVSVDGSRQQIEYAYDDFGNTVFEKWSREQNGAYVVEKEITREYHRLPNGEFVPVLEEGRDDLTGSGMETRRSAAYDDRGMELWRQEELYESGERQVYTRREAVLNANGVRTAIRSFNAETGAMEISPGWTFDDRGRVTRATAYGQTYTFTWNAEDRLTGFSGSQEGTFRNMAIVVNDAYFDPYALNPLLERAKSSMSDYVWNDYTMHEWLFSADGDRMNVRVTVDEARGEATQTIFVGEVEMQKIVYKTGDNGSYSIIQTQTGEDGTYTDERGRVYDEHGAVIKDYSEENDTGDGYHWERTLIYERTCDAEGRPLQTVCIRNGETEYTETYESWTAAAPSGVGTEEKPLLPVVEVYPSPAIDVIVIDGAPAGSTLAVFDLSGRIVYRQANISGRETVSVASWPAGLYLVSVQTPEGTVTHKTVKK